MASRYRKIVAWAILASGCLDLRGRRLLVSEELNSQQRQEVIDSLFVGRKLDAIKRYRQATGVGLAEAKHFVEQLESALRAASPEKFTAPSAGCGTAAVLLCALLLGGFATLWMVV